MPFALIISPVRSWPLDQGNRARILTIGRMLKERGYTVHFLLSGLEGHIGPQEREKMAEQWDLVEFIPYQHQRQQRYAEAWGGDDWYDPALDPVINRLNRTWSYDLCLLNYAWYSKAFDSLPADVVRIIDTHDAFGDRHKRLYDAGTTPAWYFTRPGDEGHCLDRADYVIAIQDEEQGWFEGLTRQPVRTVGHVTQPDFLAPRASLTASQPGSRGGGRGAKLRGGYMASANPSNRDSIRALIQCWSHSGFLSKHAELHVAGPICQTLSDVSLPYVIKHGFVPDPRGFFQSVDFVVNPNIGGSGLKIKSVEALGYGRPLYATVDGMLGISDEHPPYVSTSVQKMCQGMARDLEDNPDLHDVTTWSRAIYLAYRQKQIDTFTGLLDEATQLRASRLPAHTAKRS